MENKLKELVNEGFSCTEIARRLSLHKSKVIRLAKKLDLKFLYASNKITNSKVEVTCPNCNKKNIRTISEVKSENFCDIQCRNEYRKDNKLSFTPKIPYQEYDTGNIFFHKKEGRYYVYLKNKSKKFCTSLARYKMSVKLGRLLLKEEQVDHIDANKANDDIHNLQVLSIKDNALKRVKEYNLEANFLDIICSHCKKPFKISKRNYKTRSKNHKTINCSRECLNDSMRKVK